MPQKQTLLNWVPPIGSRAAGVRMLQPPEEPQLRTQVPALYGLLAGLVGSAPDELARGSVLDDEAQLRNAGVRAGAIPGFGLSSLAQMVPALRPLLGGPQLASRVPQLAPLSRQTGAISIGGHEGLVASHTFNPEAAAGIASSGQLRSPSIGITNKINPFWPERPSLVFPAGEIKPEIQGGTLINRDGYFANPTGLTHAPGKAPLYDAKKHIEDILTERALAQKTYGTQDLRAMTGGAEGSQLMTILASPTFSSTEQFESSMQGAHLLSKFNPNFGMDQPAWVALQNLIDRRGWSYDDIVNMYRAQNSGHTFDKWPLESRLAWLRARQAPSEMAEYKEIGSHTVTPKNAVVYLPNQLYKTNSMEWLLDKLTPLRDKGHQFVTNTELSAYGAPADQVFPMITPPSGGFALPPRMKTGQKELDDWLLKAAPSL